MSYLNDMKYNSSTELKSVLMSKRVNFYFLEHCRVCLNGGRVEYLCNEDRQASYWNIPIANTTFILLGSGTSITQGAVRELSKAGVSIGFSGGGGTPLYASTELSHEITFIQGQSEYRPTQYMQLWMQKWLNENKRLLAAKSLMLDRLDLIETKWKKSNLMNSNLKNMLEIYRQKTDSDIQSHQELFLMEAELTKGLYKFMSQNHHRDGFTRNHKGIDKINRLLNYGNYLAYGLAASALWVLGIPHSLAVFHGKTRRGGLVFDIADVIKDGMVLPMAFIEGANGVSEEEFKVILIKHFNQESALDLMIDSIKKICDEEMIS
jgi:CRISPR-associated protein Cas1